jgi:hypothetical protein
MTKRQLRRHRLKVLLERCGSADYKSKSLQKRLFSDRALRRMAEQMLSGA